MSTITKVDRPAVATNCNLGCRDLCWCRAVGYGRPDLCRAIDSCNTKSEEVITVGDADARVTFVDALARLRSANAAFVAEVRRCYGEKPLGSAIKKCEYRIADSSIAVIDDNGVWSPFPRSAHAKTKSRCVSPSFAAPIAAANSRVSAAFASACVSGTSFVGVDAHPARIMATVIAISFTLDSYS